VCIYIYIYRERERQRERERETESDDTKCCIYTILPPQDEHSIARNIYRNVILCE